VLVDVGEAGQQLAELLGPTASMMDSRRPT
jgi:hypothetical protein